MGFGVLGSRVGLRVGLLTGRWSWQVLSLHCWMGFSGAPRDATQINPGFFCGGSDALLFALAKHCPNLEVLDLPDYELPEP